MVLLLIFIVFSLAVGLAAYGIPTRDWGGAFTLSSLIVACLALILAVFALNQYLGMERLYDDDVNGQALSGMYQTHYTDEVLRKRTRSM